MLGTDPHLTDPGDTLLKLLPPSTFAQVTILARHTQRWTRTSARRTEDVRAGRTCAGCIVSVLMLLRCMQIYVCAYQRDGLEYTDSLALAGTRAESGRTSFRNEKVGVCGAPCGLSDQVEACQLSDSRCKHGEAAHDVELPVHARILCGSISPPSRASYQCPPILPFSCLESLCGK
ncbi:hypothetical protein BC834DRAFT_875497 [Gloeopeniophorella convolvens]|nr:hypothetical protein BC834DRAFT_875497 [Gloeopeniophorella convolvens]